VMPLEAARPWKWFNMARAVSRSVMLTFMVGQDDIVPWPDVE
jgi:hypothetical protein